MSGGLRLQNDAVARDGGWGIRLPTNDGYPPWFQRENAGPGGGSVVTNRDKGENRQKCK